MVNGVRYPLPATVFIEKAVQKNKIFDRNDKTLNNLFGWIQAAVTDYNSEKKVWTVFTLDGLKREFLLPRIYIRFHGEDPRKFTQRIANAVKRRQIAEATIRLICVVSHQHNKYFEVPEKIIIALIPV